MYLEGRPIGGGTGHEAGRSLLADMYRRYVGTPMPQILVAERGKPCFARGGWHFSVSHTKRYVFCALSRKPVGIDAEEMDRTVRLFIAPKILSDSEYTRFLGVEDKRLALLKLWVLKEAQGKLTGEGIRFHPTHTNFSLDDPRVTIMHNCLVAVMEEEDDAV